MLSSCRSKILLWTRYWSAASPACVTAAGLEASIRSVRTFESCTSDADLEEISGWVWRFLPDLCWLLLDVHVLEVSVLIIMTVRSVRRRGSAASSRYGGVLRAGALVGVKKVCFVMGHLQNSIHQYIEDLKQATMKFCFK